MNQFVESLKRLYNDKKIDEQTIIRLFNEDKISKEEKLYILC